MNSKQIKKRLESYFLNDKVEVFDTRGTEDHFSIIVISDKFNDINIVKRHQMIYQLFKNEITKEIHALQIQTYTNLEWKEKNISM
jgi:BolA protein